MERLDNKEAEWRRIAMITGDEAELLAIYVSDDDPSVAQTVSLELRDNSGVAVCSASYHKNPRILRRKHTDSKSLRFEFELKVSDEEAYLFGHPQREDFIRTVIDHHFQTKIKSSGLWVMLSGEDARRSEMFERLGFKQADCDPRLNPQESYYALPRTNGRPRLELPAG